MTERERENVHSERGNELENFKEREREKVIDHTKIDEHKTFIKTAKTKNQHLNHRHFNSDCLN